MAGLVEKAKRNNVKLVFPVDYVTADKFDKDAKVFFLCSNAVIILIIVILDRHCNREGRYPGWLDRS